MTFKQFKYLDKIDQEYFLWKRGVEIARKADAVYHYVLFQVDAFYMEVQITMPQKAIIQIACFEDTDLLEPYLKNINIDSLYAD